MGGLSKGILLNLDIFTIMIRYDKIGDGYNTTRKADPYLTSRLLHFLQPGAGKQYLDIGCGTGNYTTALADEGFHFTGIDPSEKMLAEGRARNQKITWISGIAEQIPVGDARFDGAIATLTIHHWTNLEKAFLEISRILSSTGRLVIFTATPEQMEGYWLKHYFPQMIRDCIVQMPSFERVETAIMAAGLEVISTEKYFVQDDLQDHFLYVGKRNPDFYFNETNRKGISAFAALSNIVEVDTGLQQLKQDVADKTFDSVRKSYENDLGDYLFVVVGKKGG